MSERVRILIVEDEPSDAELVVHALMKSGFDPEWRRVDTAEGFRKHLADGPVDAVISDHALPQFSSNDALQCLRDSGRKIPFIVVSHAIGEEEAVALLRQGAADYLMKDRLGRLGKALRQALEEQRLWEAHAAAQDAIVALNKDLERRIAERTAELQIANRTLQGELESRKRAEEALRGLNMQLEQRIEERTRDIVSSNHRLRALASELTVAEQRERKRLAGELHDYLAQMLALGRIKISQLRPKLKSTDPSITDLVRDVDDVFKKASEYTRSLMAKLSPPVLDELGLPAALTWLAEQMPLHGLKVEVRLSQEKVPLPDEQSVLLFQSVRELLLNVAKHAGTDRATVSLCVDCVDSDQHLRIDVQDAGQGFDAAAIHAKSAGEHFGLFSVRERMESMGGRLSIQSAAGQGTTITLALPLGAAPVEESGTTSERVKALSKNPR